MSHKTDLPLNCLIVDDEPLAHNVIINYANDLDYIEISAQAYRPTEALKILRSTPIDLMFLDIKMPKMSGLEMLRISSSHPLVIITSAYEEYALEGYELNVCDYLLKPFRFERFVQACQKAWDQLRVSKHSNENTRRYFVVKSDKRFIRIAEEEIIFIESYGNYVKLWLGEHFVVTPRTLSSFMKDLPESSFFKIHKSYLINISHIQYVEGNSVKMANDRLLPISKNYKPAFLEFFQKRQM